MYVVMYERSEAEVEAESEVRREPERLELVAGVVVGVARLTVDFRIETAVVRPAMKVARREVHRRRAAAEIPAGERLREGVRHRDLPPPNERRRLEETVERLRGIVERRHGHRLLLERRARHDPTVHELAVHESIAVLPAHAPDALRVVVPLVAALVLEERRDAKLAAKPVDDRCREYAFDAGVLHRSEVSPDGVGGAR